MSVDIKFAGVLGLLLLVAVLALYLSSGNSVNIFSPTGASSTIVPTPEPSMTGPSPSSDAPSRHDYYELAVIIIVVVALLFLASMFLRRH